MRYFINEVLKGKIWKSMWIGYESNDYDENGKKEKDNERLYNYVSESVIKH